MPVTAQQERFCREYVIDLNGSAAYRRAYPKVSEKVARTNASRLLKDPDVQARIAQLQRPRLERSELTADRVLRELMHIAFADARVLYRPDGSLKAPHEWDEATAAAIAGVETEEAFNRVAPAQSQQQPQPQGGSLTRNTAQGEPIRTHKVKRWDKLRALELLCKHFGLLKEDAPHPDAPQLDLAKLTDVQKNHLLTALRIALGSVAAGGPPAAPGPA